MYSSAMSLWHFDKLFSALKPPTKMIVKWRPLFEPWEREELRKLECGPLRRKAHARLANCSAVPNS